jgi:hypothetical protein
MRKIFMQVFAFMIMAVSQLLFLEVAHANTIYTITKFSIVNMDPVNYQVDIHFGEQAARRITLPANRTYVMVDTDSSINVQKDEIKIKLLNMEINIWPTGLGYTKENISLGQVQNGLQVRETNLIVHMETYKFDSSASKVPNSLPLTLRYSVKASDTIALPNGSINWSTCKTVGAAYCPSRYAGENQEMRKLCDTSSEFLAKPALCKKIFAEFDSYNKTKPSYLPVIVYSIRAGGVGNTGPECRECSNYNNLNNQITPP